MQIGALAREVGVAADTIRFYERSGLLKGPTRTANGYRAYRPEDAAHLRLLIDLRRLGLPLDVAASLARSCHAGHCATARAELPGLVERQRSEIAARIAGLRELDARLADLERHLGEPGQERGRLPVLDADGPCCDAASAVMGVAEGGCACCSEGAGTPG